MTEEFKQIKDFIYDKVSMAVELEALLTENPALAPENGGDGELKKCEALESWLRGHGISNLERLDACDKRVASGVRPNLVATIPGVRSDFCVWVCAHMDVVPAGEISAWQSDPWKMSERDGKIFGRGTEDNQQGLASGVLAALSFSAQHIIPEHTLKLLFMADEEVGSKFGMNFIIKEHADLFSKDDLILIPDGGDPRGETIEIAEKSVLWLKFRTKGRQAHGSRPDQGCNAKLAASDLALRINGLEEKFSASDNMFEPPCSTFQPTMQLQNVSGVNIIPGEDIFCADCRILPRYTLDEVCQEVMRVVRDIEARHGVKVEVTELQTEQSTATSENAAVVNALKKAIKEVHGIEARCIGIGGGTVAASLRNLGYNAVVWSTMDEMAHQPNEYALIENIAKDAATIAWLAAS